MSRNNTSLDNSLLELNLALDEVVEEHVEDLSRSPLIVYVDLRLVRVDLLDQLLDVLGHRFILLLLDLFDSFDFGLQFRDFFTLSPDFLGEFDLLVEDLSRWQGDLSRGDLKLDFEVQVLQDLIA
jgi:hypothetical protein